ncbi:ABC transporter ATP-binding protein [Streptococcus hongkongensis]|nr:multidrug ABC transporter ATP-binding protein [Streptococcus uberis]
MISINHVGKTIKGKSILNDITLKINKGECIALIGPNGAGKSTLISCILGDKNVTTGSIKINGKSPRDQSVKSQIAILQQDNTIPNNLRINELINFFQSIAKNPMSKKEIDDLLCFTENQKNQFADKLSGGQRRLLSFILILVSKADILLLDEPTASMDTSTRKRFWEIIDLLKTEGKTILYTSHYIEEVEHTADRILILHQGQLLRDTTPYSLRSENKEKEVTLPIRYQKYLLHQAFIKELQIGKDSLHFKTECIEEVWKNLQNQGLSISDIQIQDKSLLDTLFEKTEGNNL